VPVGSVGGAEADQRHAHTLHSQRPTPLGVLGLIVRFGCHR
jgi:hypothetical protein